MVRSASPFLGREIHATCMRLKDLGVPGPNGISVDYYLHHPRARSLLSQLAKFWFAWPEIMTKFMAASKTIVLGQISGSFDSMRVVQRHNIEPRIFTNILAEQAIATI
ncbi:hypothetical protein GGI20_001246, partial [Coemansia sp. BCRC 34301]